MDVLGFFNLSFRAIPVVCQRNTRVVLVLLKILDHLLNYSVRKTNFLVIIFLALKAGCIEQFTTSSPRLLRIFPIVQIDIYEYLGLALLCLRGSRTPRRRNLDVKDRDLEIEKGQAGL